MALPDVLAAMIYWCRADPVLAPLHGGRVSSRLPTGAELPYVRVFDPVVSPPDKPYRWTTPLLQWDVFAGRIFDDRVQPDYVAAKDIALELADRFRAFDGHSPEFPGFRRSIEWEPGKIVYVRGVVLTFGPGRQEDPEGLGRYRIDTVVHATG